MSSHDNYWKNYGLWGDNNEYTMSSITDTPGDYLHNQDISTPSQSKEVEVQIIPKLKETNEISLSKGDTLVVCISEDAMADLTTETMQSISDMFEKMFPDNQVLFLPEDFKLGVIRNV